MPGHGGLDWKSRAENLNPISQPGHLLLNQQQKYLQSSREDKFGIPYNNPFK